jgi:hypothetical protein
MLFFCQAYVLYVSLNWSTDREGLRDLLRHCKCLNSLKLEGCRNLFEVELNGACLETLWLTGCSELKYMVSTTYT